MKAIHGNIRIGRSENFITEACEYTNSFLKFNPKIKVILNIEEDHTLDFFKDIDNIRHSFKAFAEKLPDDGTLIINGEIDNINEITENLKCHVITYSFWKTALNTMQKTFTFNELGAGRFTISITTTLLLTIFELECNRASQRIQCTAPLLPAAEALQLPFGAFKSGLKAFDGTDETFRI